MKKEKFKVTNKTGMRLRYSNVKFEANESKILELEFAHEHEYFKIEKLEKKSKNKKIKLNEKIEKEERN